MSTLTPLDLDRPTRFGLVRRLVTLLSLAAIAVAWWQVLAATSAVELVTVERDGVPIDLLVPDGAVEAPGIVVAHGFSGSRQLMRSTALALAEAGFAVAVPDLAGHGANRAPLPTEDEGDRLVRDVLIAAEALEASEGVRSAPVGVLGHSMGSGAAMAAGVRAPDRITAVVAVSPTDAEVSPQLPNDLLLLAGEREPRFVANARDLLERAGGATTGTTTAPRRELVVIAGVEHVSILFSSAMYAEATAWFAESFGLPATPAGGGVPLLAWWALHLVAVVALWRVVAPGLTDRGSGSQATGRGVLGAVAGALAATTVLAILGAAVELAGFGGMLVAPVLAAWLLVAGGIWLWVGPRPGTPTGRDLGWAAVLVLLLAAALAALGSRVWLPALPGGPRAGWFALFVVLLLPWSVALSATLQGARGWRALGWWTLLAVVTTGGFAAAAVAVPSLGFLLLLLPLIPVLLTVAVVAWLPVQRPWAGGIAMAVLLAWMLAILFPLV
ncbi:MAG: alpha/beta hydrolase family protein [Actinomycetota bacterium]